MVKEMPHVRNVFVTAGGFLFGGSTAEVGGRGSMTITLAPPGERDISADEWVQQMQAKINERGFPGARVFVRPPRIRGLRTNNAGTDVAVTITGRRPAGAAARWARRSPSGWRASPGCRTWSRRRKRPARALHPAGPAARVVPGPERGRRGADGAHGAGRRRAHALHGGQPRVRRAGDVRPRALHHRPRCWGPSRSSRAARAAAGPCTCATWRTCGWAWAPRRCCARTRTASCASRATWPRTETTVGEVNAEIRKRLEGLELPEGYGLIYGGEEEAIRENSRQLTDGDAAGHLPGVRGAGGAVRVASSTRSSSCWPSRCRWWAWRWRCGSRRRP